MTSDGSARHQNCKDVVLGLSLAPKRNEESRFRPPSYCKRELEEVTRNIKGKCHRIKREFSSRPLNGNPTKRIERALTIEYSPITYGKDLLNFAKNGHFPKTNHFSFAGPVRFAPPLTKINGNPAKRIVRGRPAALPQNNPSPQNEPVELSSPRPPCHCEGPDSTGARGNLLCAAIRHNPPSLPGVPMKSGRRGNLGGPFLSFLNGAKRNEESRSIVLPLRACPEPIEGHLPPLTRTQRTQQTLRTQRTLRTQ
jgi:hypothetical protein